MLLQILKLGNPIDTLVTILQRIIPSTISVRDEGFLLGADTHGCLCFLVHFGNERMVLSIGRPIQNVSAEKV